MASFAGYSRQVLGRAYRNGLGRMVGLFIGLLIAITTLGLQFSFGLVPNGNGPMRWLAIALGQIIVFGPGAWGYIWHAAWEEHKHAEAQIADLKAKAENLASLRAAEALFQLMVRLAVSLSGVVIKPLKQTEDPATLQFQASYDQYMILWAHFSLPVPSDRLHPLPSDQQHEKTKGQIGQAFQAHLGALTAYTQELRDELLSEPRLL